MKKFNKIIAIILIIAVFVGSIFYYASQNDILGWRLNFQIQKVETRDYKGLAPNIYFRYPIVFEIDGDAENKYGPAYVVGIKLKTDNRTGCDIRIDGPELDHTKTEDELVQQVTEEISKNAKDFKIVSKEKMKIDGREAFKVSFSFLDPIGARVQLDQIFVSNDNMNYFIICGTGEQQYNFFRKDFSTFFDSIDFDVEESDFVQ